MHKGENNREGKGKDITTGKGKRKLKEKGKEESKEKLSRWARKGEGKRKGKCTGTGRHLLLDGR